MIIHWINVRLYFQFPRHRRIIFPKNKEDQLRPDEKRSKQNRRPVDTSGEVVQDPAIVIHLGAIHILI